LTKDVKEAVEQYNVLTYNTQSKMAVTPITQGRLTDRQWKFLNTISKLFPNIKPIFVDYRSTQATTTLTNHGRKPFEIYDSKNGKTYVFVDSNGFKNATMNESVISFAKSLAANNFLKNGNKGEIKKLLKQTDELKDNADITDEDLSNFIVDIITNPKISAKVFSTDKKTTKALIKTISSMEKSEKNIKFRQAYNNLKWTLRKNIASEFPRKAKMLVLKQLDWGLKESDIKLIATIEEEARIIDAIERTNTLDVRNIELEKYRTTLEFIKNNKKSTKKVKEKISKIENELTTFEQLSKDYEASLDSENDVEVKLANIKNENKLLSLKLSKNEITKEIASKNIEQQTILEKQYSDIQVKNSEYAKNINQAQDNIIKSLNDLIKTMKDYKDALVEKINVVKNTTISSLVKMLGESEENAEQYDNIINEATPNYPFH
jgi:hypothetical protein